MSFSMSLISLRHRPRYPVRHENWKIKSFVNSSVPDRGSPRQAAVGSSGGGNAQRQSGFLAQFKYSFAITFVIDTRAMSGMQRQQFCGRRACCRSRTRGNRLRREHGCAPTRTARRWCAPIRVFDPRIAKVFRVQVSLPTLGAESRARFSMVSVAPGYTCRTISRTRLFGPRESSYQLGSVPIFVPLRRLSRNEGISVPD